MICEPANVHYAFAIVYSPQNQTITNFSCTHTQADGANAKSAADLLAFGLNAAHGSAGGSPSDDCALVLEGGILGAAFNDPVPRSQLVALCLCCRTVLCCRASGHQKRKVRVSAYILYERVT